MKLVSLSIRNYRSITNTSKLHLRDGITTLIGPNNEGKSNVLRALVAALEVASRLDEFKLLKGGRLMGRHLTERFYTWDTDFPIALQSSQPKGVSEFDLDFQLNAAEITSFKSEVGSSLNGTLPIRIGLGQAEPTFSVRKKGPGATTLSAKASKIAQFIGKRLDLQYIPAVRPAATSTSAVQRMVARELEVLRVDPEYQKAVQRIEELQQPMLQKIGASIRDTLKVFLPDVKDVQVQIPSEARFRALRSCEVIVDDGTPTSLDYKGDGVQSLAALGIMRDSAQGGASAKQLVLAVEEPESHLHPHAIHQLRGVLGEIAKQHQVIITTHCPLFVDRHDIGSNILVADNRAAPAKTVKAIREIMGVRVSDNLVAAEVMLLVEGEDDRIAIRALLSHYSPKLKKALANGLLGIDTLAGSGNLSYKLTLSREAMYLSHALMDNDLSGQQAVKHALDHGLLTIADLTYASVPGMGQSELEDWYDSAVISPMLTSTFGTLGVHPLLTATNKKWSDRMKQLFQKSGKPWNDAIEMQVKLAVARLVESTPGTALHSARKTPFEALVQSLESKLAS